MTDTIIIVVLLTAAVAWFVYTQVRKFKRLSSKNGGSCCGSCESCPFCKSGDSSKNKKSGGGCGCGCGG